MFPSVAIEFVTASIAQIEIANHAREKLELPDGCIFMGAALEQASSMHAAALHAELLGERGSVVEICGGIGSDSVAIAKRAGLLACIEADPIVARMLQHNLRACGVENATVLCDKAEDRRSWISSLNPDAIFADPSRRSAGARTLRTELYSPSLDFLKALSRLHPMLVKASPASTVDDAHWKKIFVAVGNECKEQLLLHGFEQPDCSVMDAASGERWIPSNCETPFIREERFLIEPHNAIIRSGFVRDYFFEHNALPLDPKIAYGIANDLPTSTRWHDVFRIMEIFPFNKKHLQKKIYEYNFSSVTEIKKRGFPLLPEQARSLLKFKGSNPGVIFLTRKGEQHLVILAERVV